MTRGSDKGEYPTDQKERRLLHDRRARAARRFRPERVKLLLIAEAPTNGPDRYFYFPDVPEHDALFRYVVRGILKTEPTRSNKRELLGHLRDAGVFLIDLKLDPVDDTPLARYVPGLVRRAKKLRPEKVILIKASVYDEAYADFVVAGLPVVDERVPFPGSGQQRRFEKKFARALRRRPVRQGSTI